MRVLMEIAGIITMQSDSFQRSRGGKIFAVRISLRLVYVDNTNIIGNIC